MLIDLTALDINPTYLLGGVIGGLAIIVLVVFLTVRLLLIQKTISSRIDQFIRSDFIREDEESKERRIIQREVTGSLFSRTIANWARNVIRFLGKFTPDTMAKNMDHKLTVAGNPANLTGQTFFVIRVVILVFGVAVAFLLNRNFNDTERISLYMGMGLLIICIVYPSAWLNGRARNRKDEIRRALPDVLDMLSVCASAGLGFDQSLQKISTYWDTELGREIGRTTQEMEMGITRSQALRNLSNRLEVNDLSQFVAIIIQAEKIGMSVADVLTNQANQLRVMRQVRAREMANKLPAKMIIPVLIFIFPAMIAVILGPAIPLFMNLF